MLTLNKPKRLTQIQLRAPFKRSDKREIAEDRLLADLKEIHQYVEDLKEVTGLRDKCLDPEEKTRYNEVIKIMQLVMQRLNELGGINGRFQNMEKFGLGQDPGQRQGQSG